MPKHVTADEKPKTLPTFYQISSSVLQYLMEFIGQWVEILYNSYSRRGRSVGIYRVQQKRF